MLGELLPYKSTREQEQSELCQSGVTFELQHKMYLYQRKHVVSVCAFGTVEIK